MYCTSFCTAEFRARLIHQITTQRWLMANASTCIFVLVSIACATAFQAPAPRTHYGHAHALEKARAPQAPQHSTGLPLRRRPASFHGPAAPVMNVAVLEFAVPIAVTVPRLPSLVSFADMVGSTAEV